MSRTIVLVGGMASGKTTLAKFLRLYEYNKIVTYTTRPPREGEITGVDYHFLTNGEFITLDKEGFFAESTYYDTVFGKWYYGSSKTSYLDDEENVIVLNPRGVMNLKVKARVIWLDLPEDVRMRRAFLRGDNAEETARRLFLDRLEFADFADKHLYDLRITDELPLEELAKKIINDKLFVSQRKQLL